MIGRFGHPEPCFSQSPALSECTQLGMAPGEPGTGLHGGQDNLSEALITLRPVEGGHSLPEAVDRPTIFPLGPMGIAEVEVHQRVQNDIPVARGQREGTPASGNSLVMRAYEKEIVC